MRSKMNYPIQDVFSDISEQELQNANYNQIKIVHDITKCKTAHMGGHHATCHECGHQTIHYNSCKNRHCPCCGQLDKEKWIDKIKASLVDAPYFHVVFTVPHELNPIFLSNKKILYNLLFKASADTLKELAADPKYKLQADIGFISLLHTWGSDLSYHPHIHIILLAGGLNNNKQFVKANGEFLFPFPVMAKLFRGKFLSTLNKLWKNNHLEFKPFSDADFVKLKNLLYKKKWVPYAKKTFGRGEHVIEYIGRYSHRIAISNARIIAYDKDTVSFRCKEYKTKKNVIKTLSAKEFRRRFLMHELPKRFVKTRHFGIFSNRNKQGALSLIQSLLDSSGYQPILKGLTTQQIILKLYDYDTTKCPQCQSHNLKVEKFRRVKRE